MAPALIFIKLDGFGIVVKNMHQAFEAAFGLQTLFDFFEKLCANSLPAKVFANSKMIDHSAPSIKAADDRANDLSTDLSNEEQVRVAFQFSLGLLRGIGASNIHTLFDAAPERDHAVIIICE